eukprot:Gb_24068 [translate_table: standard]
MVASGLVIFLPTKRAAVLKALKKIRKKRSGQGSEQWKSGDVDRPDSSGEICTYTVHELAKATDNFTTIVGEGGFGTVYCAKLGDNRIGAVKRAKILGMRDSAVFKEELSVLLRLRHPCLVNLIGLCSAGGEQILVFEFIPKGSLYDRMHTEKGRAEGPLPWEARMNIAFQVAVSLQYLHEEAKPTVVHRDV